MADSWAVKYRPQKFSDVVGNIRQSTILRESVKRHQEPPAAFLAGSRGCGKCFSINSFIYTEKGIERVSDVFPKGKHKPDTFIPFEYGLWNMFGEIENTSWAYYNGIKPCRYFLTDHGFTVTCTYNHPLYVYSYAYKSFGWKLSSELTKGDCLTIPVSIDLAELKSKMESIETDGLLQVGDFYVDPIILIEQVECETVDFTMPKSHSLIVNGLVNHNTTTARLYAKAMCCEHLQEDGEPCNECDSCKEIMAGSYPDVIEVDAASENSVQGIRDLIKTLNYLPTRGDKKVIIIDECLTADTDVLMSDYTYHKIHTIRNGDLVLAYNPKDHLLYPAKVSNCFSKQSEIVCVRTEFGKVKGSPNHRMLVKDVNDKVLYKHLCEISLMDSLCLMDYYGTLKNGPMWEKVTTIETLPEETVYDFEVETYHNFIANGFVSHNCHSLSQAATNALLKTLEEPPEFVRFVFCTTDPQKVLETIRSRCLMFRFNDITTRDIEARLRFIADKEGVKIDQAALNAIARNSNGGMRDSIMLLEQAHLANVSGEEIKPANILELVGSVSVRDIQKLFMSIKSGDHNQLLEWLETEKFAPIDILNSSISFLETVILIKQGVSPAEFVSKDLVAGVMSLASTISFHDVSVMFDEFRGIIYDLRNLTGVSTSAVFKLRMLNVIDRLTFQPGVPMQGQSFAPQQSFLQKVKAEFNVERIPLPI